MVITRRVARPLSVAMLVAALAGGVGLSQLAASATVGSVVAAGNLSGGDVPPPPQPNV